MSLILQGERRGLVQKKSKKVADKRHLLLQTKTLQTYDAKFVFKDVILCLHFGESYHR